ncbi:protein FAR1-RELATED SEQUENCE 5-like [Cornus florida]|uniref:protein FAR1-RELATED SEQUENCE 5-like n=1 Tax=Cornus florida TaxID=4283 RepID=UPI00289776FD|nr:protein FAR1-RELATED SEQUENCE 5-like [Cornus florida]
MDNDLSINNVRTSVPIVAEINISENLVAEVVNPIDIEFTPKLNMQFDTEDEAYDFYNAYGGKVGFSIRKDYANKSRKTGNITTSKFVCSKQGFRVKEKRDIHTRKPRAETRTGCGALMQIRYDRKKGKYVVYNFVESHNHPMIIEECTHMMPSQRRISVAQAIDVELACQSGVPLGNAFELMSRQAGGRQSIGYTKVDQQNFLRTRRQSELEYGEKTWLMNYFKIQSCENPSFFHTVQLDSDEMITNIFWADSRMIIDYGHFGDVVTFDTTYKLVQSNRPFAAFLGLNHHRETAVFGLALMYDETANSFACLFDSFLNVMSGKAPQTILTDQDGAMAKALAQVMPRTRHLLCTWHIMANAQKHVGTIFRNDEGIKSVLSQFMYCYDDEDDFCIQWDVMLRDYNVVGNTWLNNLFGLREKWGYPFVKHWFTAGMRTTQLSESLNSCLKEYLTRKMSIPDFFMHLDRLLSDKRYKEYQAEYGLLSKLLRLKQNCPILKQVGNMYTLKIFELFEDQFIEACVVGTVEGTSFDENGLRVSRVSVHDGSMDRTVTRWDDGFLTCSCGKYAMEGILCSHVLKVLKDDAQYFKELPSMYILKRWTRKARDNSVQDIRGCEVIADPKLEVRRRYRMLCRFFTEISSFASEKEDVFNNLMLKGMKWKRKHINVERQCFDVGQEATNSAFSTERSNNHEHNETIIGEAVTGSNAKGIKNKETGGKGPRRRKKNKFEQYMQRKKNYAKRKKSNGNNSVSAGVGGSSTVPPITYVRLNVETINFKVTWFREWHLAIFSNDGDT